jgi:hypothetical protein
MIAATNIAVADQLPWRLISTNEALTHALNLYFGSRVEFYEAHRPVVIILLS